MTSNYPKAKGKGDKRSFVMLTHNVIDSENFQSLSGNALKMLIALSRQYNGYNNGDLCASRSVLRSKGWKSNNSIRRALKQLLERGWIIQTRFGGLGLGCSLYALTWRSIDDCNNKIEVAATKTPSNNWRGWQVR